MIGYLKGRVLEHSEGKILLVAGESGSVGYSVTVPQSAGYIKFVPGGEAELFIHTHVREDALDLFGFASKVEKDVFLTLLTVNGIGPRGAMGILSGVEPGDLIRAILEGDKEFLVKIPGVGKKTAERVVLELAEPIRKKMDSGQLPDLVSAGASSKNARGASSAARRGENPVLRDARTALVGLGYRESDISGMLNRLFEEAETPVTRTEDLIKLALKQLAF